MKKALLLLCVLVLASTSLTAAPKKKKAVVPRQQTESELSRDMHFDDAVVRGKYQYADEATAIVEDEKTLDDLVGMRASFKDRMKREIDRQ